MADKYYRLVSFMVNICPEPLRELFTKEAKGDQGTSYTTLDSYLGFKKPQIRQLILKSKLRQDQFDILFPSPGTDPDVSQWDISLLSMLITDFFGKTLQNNIVFFINEIRDARNILQHTSSTSCMSDLTFDETWKRLETATLFLANEHGTDYECQMKQKINHAKLKNMPDLGNTLSHWFEEIITQMRDDVKEISTYTKDIQNSTRESTAIIRSATVSKEGPSGEKVKRLKTVDKKLKTMQDNFERTMNSEIPDNYDAPPEVDRIKTQLRDNRLVVVTGHNNSHYVAAALSAVKDMSYNGKRCAELQSSSDWKHVDPEEVDFVLYCHPFGNGVYDEEKSKGMADIFNNIQHTVKEERDDNKLAVMIVTDVDVLYKCKERHDHEILEEVVTVYHSTSVAQPADLTVSKCIPNCPSTSAVAKNLTELSGLFLKLHKREVDPDVLKAAKAKIKAHKAVVLTGPQGSGKTSLAVALADSYHPSQVLLLTYPEQVQHVDLNQINLVVIEDFVGKYGFDKIQIWNWYKTFELLFVMKSAGKLNIIITCDIEKLEKCRDEIADHPLLEHSLKLLSQCVLVKQEKSNTDVPPQRQQITTQPQQSHVVSVSSHVEHGSNSSSNHLAQPPNVHTQAAQSLTAHTRGTQSLLPAHTQAAQSQTACTCGTQSLLPAHSQAPSSLYRTPHFLTTPFTPFTMSIEPESPRNLSIPKYTSLIGRKECVSLKEMKGGKGYIQTCMCLTKDMSLYVAVSIIESDWLHCNLHYIDKNTNNTIKYSLKHSVDKMCCTDTGDIVVTHFSNVSLLRIIDGSPVVIKTTTCIILVIVRLYHVMMKIRFI